MDLIVSDPGDGDLLLTMRPHGSLETTPPASMRLMHHTDDLLVFRSPGFRGCSGLAFYEVDGERYVHNSARAARRV